MTSANDRTLGYRLLHTVLPSSVDVLISITVALVVVGGYLLGQSVSIGTSLPDIFDGEWGIAYTNNIVQPLASIFSNNTVGTAAVAFMWGLAGLALYILIEMVTRTYRGLREANSYIQLTDSAIVRRPSLRSFFVVLLWRIATVAVFSLLLAVLIFPVMHSLGAAAPQIVLGQLMTVDVTKRLASLILGVALSFHVIVVFLRLFLMRMRIFS
jgi:hypothetical protein